MENLIKTMNEVLNEWKGIYLPNSNFNLSFSESPDGFLCFNGKELCKAENLEVLSADFSSLNISFYFKSDRFIEIEIEWPEEEPPYISSVVYGFDTPHR